VSLRYSEYILVRSFASRLQNAFGTWFTGDRRTQDTAACFGDVLVAVNLLRSFPTNESPLSFSKLNKDLSITPHWLYLEECTALQHSSGLTIRWHHKIGWPFEIFSFSTAPRRSSLSTRIFNLSSICRPDCNVLYCAVLLVSAWKTRVFLGWSESISAPTKYITSYGVYAY
jgi:hypothetical protein